MKRNLRFKLDWASLIVGRTFTAFALLFFAFDQQFPSTSPRGLIFGGGFNAGFFVLRVWGAYNWRGLYLEGLVFGILRYTATGCTEVCWLLQNAQALSLPT